jgi:broad specificity phosphatase PhoE
MYESGYVRHGQNKDNANGILNGHRDEPLTEIGVNQAQEIALEIKAAGFIFTHVYSSPLIRALNTAEIISEMTKNPKPEVLELLIERDFGVMTGVEQSKIEDLCSPEIMNTSTITYFLSPKGAETFPELIERANKLLVVIHNKHADGDILFVTHGDFGKMIYAAYYLLPWEEVLTSFHFGNSEMLQLSRDTDPKDSHLFRFAQHNH